MMSQQKRIPVPRLISKTSNNISSSTKCSPNINNLSMNSDSHSSISTIRSVNSTTNNGLNESTISAEQQSVNIGSISMSRSSSMYTSTNKTDSFSLKSAPGDLIKQIEELVSRNKTLEEENMVLKNLIHEEKSSTNGNKEIDERRILMLKCQIYQLEKQINILSKTLSFRKNAHTDALNTISVLSDSFRSIVQTAESRTLNPVTTITVNKSDLIKWTEISESTRIKLEKTEENSYDEFKKQSEPSLLNSNFSKPNKKIDILDICSGNLDHINLKQIALLESNLSQVYKKLYRLKVSLKTFQPKNKSDQLLPIHKDNLKIQIEDCIKITSETCQNLFDLTLIVPSAPWPATKTSPVDKLTQENLILKLKSINLPKIKFQSVECLFKAYHVAVNYHFFMKTLEVNALNEEVNFYRSSYSVQKSYIDSLMNLFKTKYYQFINELKENLNEPLRSLIHKFNLMKENSTEDNLKDFLHYFKLYSKKFDKILNNMDQCLPDADQDMIGTHFNTLIIQLDEQISKLNKQCAYNLEQLNIEKLKLQDLSVESDQLVNDFVKLTPNISPSVSFNDLRMNQ